VPGLERTFEALVLDGDGAALPDTAASARAVVRRLEGLCAAGLDVAVLSSSDVAGLDARLSARPSGPGRLFYATGCGAELHTVDTHGPRMLRQRSASTPELAALERAGPLLVERFAEHGLAVVSAPSGHDRTRVDLLPPRSRGAAGPRRHADLAAALAERLRETDLQDLSAVVEVAVLAGKEAGLADPRVTTDLRHLELGVSDHTDSLRRLLREFAARGISPGLTLLVGSDFGPHLGRPGDDLLLLTAEGAGVAAVSVGAEPAGVPADVRHLPGGTRTVLVLLDEQLRRRADRRVPSIDPDPEWVVTLPDSDSRAERAQESLLALADGVIGLRGGYEEPARQHPPLVLAAGVYAGEGQDQRLLEGPWPLSLDLDPGADPGVRQLDLRSGLLLRESGAVRTVRFVAADRQGVVAQRAEAPAARLTAGPLHAVLARSATTSGRSDGHVWARASGDGGGICVVADQVVCRARGRRTVERLAAYATDPVRPPPVSRAASVLGDAEQAGFDQLLAGHRAAWGQRWDGTCVWIPDDLGAQLAVRFALFHLWSSVASHDEAAVGARGLTGPGYAGHVFWDADVFVLPALCSMRPAAARAMLEYRLRRLPQARTNARLRGLSGARFPWESAATGAEVTPVSRRANGEWVPVLTGQLEEHIVADVAWAACHYAAWTGDSTFLTGAGHDLVTDTARYWASRCWTDVDGRAHIRHVIGPDEYHEAVDDNVYTNVLARWTLRRGADLTASPEEAAAWRELAASLVDGFDPGTGRHEQFRGYDQLEPLLATDLGTPPLAADLLLGSARVSASQVVKQPDVLMAHHLLPGELPAGSLAADLDHYLPRTSHGSSLSPAVTASLLARAGRADEAVGMLDIALRLDLDDLTGMTGSGLHLATLAGVWQALLFGFAGARVEAGTLSLDPVLPSRWGSLRLRFRCMGRHVELAVAPDSALVTASGPLAVRTPVSGPVVVTDQVRLVKDDNGWVVRS
jgi:trehalose/maltose hydrolase-like predicted phosphorylase